MALDNYADLQLAIQSWADRNDAGFVSACPDFIALFEATANTEISLETRFNTNSTSLSLTSATNLVPLPADFQNAKAFVNTTPQPVQVVPIYSAASLYTNVASPLTTGQPLGVTITGTNAEFAPNADKTYAIELYYYQIVPPLASQVSGTNWLLTNFPNLYLFGSLLAAEAFLGTDPRIELWGQLYDNVMQKIAGSTARGQYGSPLSVRVDAVV